MILGLIVAVMAGVVASAAGVALVYRYPDRVSAWVLCLTLILLLWRRTTAWLMALGDSPQGGMIHWFDAVVTPIAAAAMLTVLAVVLAVEFATFDRARRDRDTLADKLRSKA